MNKFLALAFASLLVMSVGCQNKNGDSHDHGGSMKASMDACPNCPGKQTANADGTCPVCKAQVGKAGAAADVCTHCAGVQTATADGKCSACGAMVAKK